MDHILKEYRHTREEKLTIDVAIERIHLRALLENSIPHNDPNYNTLLKQKHELKEKEMNLRKIICEYADNEEENGYESDECGPTRRKYYKLGCDIYKQEAHQTLNKLRKEWCEQSRRLYPVKQS